MNKEYERPELIIKQFSLNTDILEDLWSVEDPTVPGHGSTIGLHPGEAGISGFGW